MNDDNKEVIQEIIQEERHKPSRREVAKMIFGAYLGMLPLLISFIVMMVLMFVILIAWGG